MPRVATISLLVASLNLPSMETQTRSLGPTQPVPSFVSSKSARSQTLSRSDVCAKFVTTTADGRTEGMNSILSLYAAVIIDSDLPHSNNFEYWEADNHWKEPVSLVA